MNDTPQTVDTSTQQNSAVDAFTQIVKHFMEEGKGINSRITSAKTEVKRQYYKKKLVKNNQLLAQALMMLEKYKRRNTTTTLANTPQIEETPKEIQE